MDPLLISILMEADLSHAEETRMGSELQMMMKAVKAGKPPAISPDLPDSIKNHPDFIDAVEGIMALARNKGIKVGGGMAAPAAKPQAKPVGSEKSKIMRDAIQNMQEHYAKLQKPMDRPQAISGMMNFLDQYVNFFENFLASLAKG